MAATISILRKVNQRKLANEDAKDENLFSELTIRLPPKEKWIEEHVMCILILG
jgi:hypothetical protein